MRTIVNRKALRIGIGLVLSSVVMVTLFQNCSKAGSPSSGAGASNVSPVSTSSYDPIRMDVVCTDSSADKKAMINTYIRLLHRCADRPGLDYWYNVQIRKGMNVLSHLEADIRSSDEFKNQNLAGQMVSDRFCLSGDAYQISANGQVLTAAQLDTVSTSDARVFSSSCKTSSAQNISASASRVVRDTISTAHDAHGGYICSVAGDTLKNHIIDVYIGYLDRCPDAEGLKYWAANWPGDAAFVGNDDVTGYLNCRYPGGDRTKAPQATIDTCYKQKFDTALCASGSVFVKTRFCEKTGL